MELELPRIESAGLPADVAAALRDEILAGRAGAGTRLVERDIAERLEVSRGPIRDAFKLLAAEGLVEILPRRGARVATVTREEAAEIVAIRQAVEPIAARYLVGRRDPRALEPLATTLEGMAAAARAGDWAAISALDVQFHGQIYHESRRKHLLRLWEGMRGSLLRAFRHHRLVYGNTQAAYDSHADLLGVLKEGDRRRVERAVREHVLELHQQALELLPSEAE